MQNKKQDLLSNKIRQHLNGAVAGMDGATQSKLRQARTQAIEAGLKTKPFYRPFYGRQWLPAGVALAAVLMLAVLLVPLQSTQPESVGTDLLAAGDMEILSQPEELELYEDLEFYRWMSVPEMAVPDMGQQGLG